MNPRRPEQLTFRINKNNIIQLERLISAWQIYNKNSNRGKMFENKEVVNTQKIVGYINRTLVKNKIDIKIGGHSGRNSVLLQCFEKQIDETSLKIYLRWTPNSNMHIHYRNLLLETSHVGTAYKLFKKNFNQIKTLITLDCGRPTKPKYLGQKSADDFQLKILGHH